MEVTIYEVTGKAPVPFTVNVPYDTTDVFELLCDDAQRQQEYCTVLLADMALARLGGMDPCVGENYSLEFVGMNEHGNLCFAVYDESCFGSLEFVFTMEV